MVWIFFLEFLNIVCQWKWIIGSFLEFHWLLNYIFCMQSQCGEHAWNQWTEEKIIWFDFPQSWFSENEDWECPSLRNDLKNAIRAGFKFRSQGEVAITRSRMTDKPPLISPNSLHWWNRIGAPGPPVWGPQWTHRHQSGESMLLHLLQGPQKKPRPHGVQRGGGQQMGLGHREGDKQHAQPQPPAEEWTVSLTMSALGQLTEFSTDLPLNAFCGIKHMCVVSYLKSLKTSNYCAFVY